MSPAPVRVDVKARRLPSGENNGRDSVAGCETSRRASPPAVGTSQMSPPLTNAIVAPSGEMPGSANDGNGETTPRDACVAATLKGRATSRTATAAMLATISLLFIIHLALLLVGALFVEHRDVALSLFQIRHASFHPLRLRRVLEEVVEVLGEMDRPMLLVLALAQSVFLAVVGEHVRFLAQPPHRGEELDALLPRHRVVFVVGHRQIRRTDVLDPEERRVLHVDQRILPRRHADPALRLFVLERPRHAGAPADAAVAAEHVDHRRARFHGAEDVRLRDHVRDLIAAPAVSLYADALRIDESHRQHLLDRRQYAFERAVSRIPEVVNDVGLQNDVAV